ncbi:hypothetical protein OK016_17865 [Vibrio chagasii]|nr:hypothetical protein [Vibrio chagasii]
MVEDGKLLPANPCRTHKGVVVIGKEDAISTPFSQRHGFLLCVLACEWAQEFADFLTHVSVL